MKLPREVVIYIEHELSRYEVTKMDLQDFQERDEGAVSVAALSMARTIAGIDRGMAQLPEEWRKLIRGLYQAKPRKTPEQMAKDLHISERSVTRWKSEALATFARAMNLIRNPSESAPKSQIG